MTDLIKELGDDRIRGSSYQDKVNSLQRLIDQNKMTNAQMRLELGNYARRPVDHIRWAKTAIQAIHEAAEMYLVRIFTESLFCSMHHGAVTVTQSDMQLAHHFMTQETGHHSGYEPGLVAPQYGGAFLGKI